MGIILFLIFFQWSGRLEICSEWLLVLLVLGMFFWRPGAGSVLIGLLFVKGL